MLLRSAARALARNAGYEIQRSQASIGLDQFFRLLARLGFKPCDIVDVGANHGHWTRSAINHFPNANYILIEPQAGLMNEVADLIARGTVRWITAGCSDQSGELALSIGKHDHSSTFLKNGLPTTKVRVVTLDDVCKRPPDLVKIDAEGFDLKVLNGAKSLFGKTEFFLVEAMICGDYENTAQAVINYMLSVNYRLMDITDVNRSHEGLFWTAELVFIRSESPLIKGRIF